MSCLGQNPQLQGANRGQSQCIGLSLHGPVRPAVRPAGLQYKCPVHATLRPISWVANRAGCSGCSATPGSKTRSIHSEDGPSELAALATVRRMLDDPALNKACTEGRQAWIKQAVEDPLAIHATGTQVHILGIVHDAPGNFYDIMRVVEAVQPDLVALESLPNKARSYTASAKRISNILDSLSSNPMETDAEARGALPALDTQGKFITEAIRLKGEGNASVLSAAARADEASAGSQQQQHGSGSGPGDGGLPGGAKAATYMLVTGCPMMTEELGAAHAANRLGVPLRGIDLCASKLAENMQNTTMLAMLERLLVESVDSADLRPFSSADRSWPSDDHSLTFAADHSPSSSSSSAASVGAGREACHGHEEAVASTSASSSKKKGAKGTRGRKRKGGSEEEQASGAAAAAAATEAAVAAATNPYYDPIDPTEVQRFIENYQEPADDEGALLEAGLWAGQTYFDLLEAEADEDGDQSDITGSDWPRGSSYGGGSSSSSSSGLDDGAAAAVELLLRALPPALYATMGRYAIEQTQKAAKQLTNKVLDAFLAKLPSEGSAHSDSSSAGARDGQHGASNSSRQQGQGRASGPEPAAQQAYTKEVLLQQQLRSKGVDVDALSWAHAVARAALAGSMEARARGRGASSRPASPTASRETGEAGSHQQEHPAEEEPAYGLYSLIQQTVPPALTVELMAERLQAMEVVSVGPEEMAALDAAEPRLHDTVLVHSRDEHMVRRIMHLASKGVKGTAAGASKDPVVPRKVVVVVGRAHVQGMRRVLVDLQQAALAKKMRGAAKKQLPKAGTKKKLQKDAGSGPSA